jgi:transcription factor SFP1
MSSAIPIDIAFNGVNQFQSFQGNYSNLPQQQQYQLPQQQPQKFRRESIAHSQGMGGVSWGGISVNSWLKDE